jgi:hypothetical protein
MCSGGFVFQYCYGTQNKYNRTTTEEEKKKRKLMHKKVICISQKIFVAVGYCFFLLLYLLRTISNIFQ